MNMKSLVKSLLIVGGAAGAGSALALGTSESETTDVNLTVAEVIALTEVVGGPVAVTFSTSVDFNDETVTYCIFSNSADNIEVVLNTENGNASGPRLSDGSNFIPYSAELQTTAGANIIGGAGTYVAGATGFEEVGTTTDFDGSSVNCSAGSNSKLVIDVLAADMGSAPVGSYSDTLTLTVAAN